MLIGSLKQESSIDFPLHFGPVVFTQGCNLRCGCCHNSSLAVRNSPEDVPNIDGFIAQWTPKTRAGWYQGVTVSGGEPTIHEDLPEFLARLKATGLKVKLDTNGTNPDMLDRVVEEGNLDYVAMDIKGPRRLYPLVTGVTKNYSGEVERSMNILRDSNLREGYELRTTWWPIFEDTKPRWMTNSEADEIAQWIAESSGKDTKYYLQEFVARDEKEGAMVDQRYSKDQLPKEFHRTPSQELISIRDRMKTSLPGCQIRGYEN